MKKLDCDGLAILEFVIRDLERRVQRIGPTGALVPTAASRHNSLVFSICEVVTHPEPVGTLMEQVTFKRREDLQCAIWELADWCDDCHYWVSAFLDRHEVPTDVKAVAEPCGRYGSRDGNGLAVETSFLMRIPLGHSLPITKWTGTGHLAGFRLIALPAGGNSDRRLQRVSEVPEEHPGVIEALCWEQDFVLEDACLEVRPFGEEDRDHVEIVLPDVVDKERVRSVLKRTYGVPYVIAEIDRAAFSRWEDDDRTEEPHFSEWWGGSTS